MRLAAGLAALAVLLAAGIGPGAVAAQPPKKQLHRFPFPAEAYARPAGIFNAAAVWTAQGVLAMFREAGRS